jgi:hypothetical protein
MQLASRFHLHKAQVFEVSSFNLIFLNLKRKNKQQTNVCNPSLCQNKMEKGANSKRPLHPHLARLQSQEVLKIDIWKKETIFIILLFGRLKLSNIMQSRGYYPRLYL